MKSKTKKNRKDTNEIVKEKPARRRKLPKPQNDPLEKLLQMDHHRFKPEDIEVYE